MQDYVNFMYIEPEKYTGQISDFSYLCQKCLSPKA